MRIAIEGCTHGELEKTYETIKEIEEKDGRKVDPSPIKCCSVVAVSMVIAMCLGTGGPVAVLWRLPVNAQLIRLGLHGLPGQVQRDVLVLQVL